MTKYAGQILDLMYFCFSFQQWRQQVMMALVTELFHVFLFITVFIVIHILVVHLTDRQSGEPEVRD